MKYLKKFEQQLSLFPDIIPDELSMSDKERNKRKEKRREIVKYLKEKDLLNVRDFKELPFHVVYYLYKEGVISQKKFKSLYEDLIIHNGEFVMVLYDWSDITCWKNNDTPWELSMLKGDEDFYDGDYSEYKYNFNDISDIKGDALKKLKQCMNGITFMYNDDKFTIDKNKIVMNKNLSYVDTGIEIDVKELIEDYYEFSEIKDALNFAYQDCQRDADVEQAHDAVLDAIQEAFGPIIYNDGYLYHNNDEVYFKVNFKQVSDMDEEYFKWHSYGNFANSSLIEIFNEEYKENNDGIEVDEPYYGWCGDIKNEDLNDRIYERLSEI